MFKAGDGKSGPNRCIVHYDLVHVKPTPVGVEAFMNNVMVVVLDVHAGGGDVSAHYSQAMDEIGIFLFSAHTE